MRLPAFFKPDPDSPLTQAWLVALWMGLLANGPLWQRLYALEELSGARGVYFIACFAGFVILTTGAVLSLLAWPPVAKPLLTVLLLIAAALSHFIGSYGIVFDPGMVVNTFQTDLRETRDLLSWRIAARLLLLGALPAWWLLWRRPAASPRPLARRLLAHAAGFGLGIGASVLLILASFADFSSTMRNHKDLRYMITPLNAVFSVSWTLFHRDAAPTGPPAVIGADARLLPRPEAAKPPLLVLVVGETARAMNFSLNGYTRPTNPQLAQLPVLSFSQVSSCGTATAASLPCMFAPHGRVAFGNLKQPQENLLDVLQRAGLAVLWLDNQSGCKGLCDRVPHAGTTELPPGAPALPEGLCHRDELGEECFDAALLHALDHRLAALDPQRVARGVVLVMHQMGSHGPAYFKRSPPELKPFQPECRSNALQQCPREQVVNAYDNTLVTTDHLLAGTIRWLQGQQHRFDPGVLYVSDHGESLGENGLYLHGLPYAIAPKEQTQVPMVWWLPEGGSLAGSLKPGCLQALKDRPTSHDSLFHTTLGWVGVRADVYRPDWDLLAGCRR